MLHWFYIYLYLYLVGLSSLMLFSRGLLNLILVGDVLLLILFCMGLILGSFYNVYYLFGLSFLLVVCNGVELIFNFLILTL